MYHPDCNESNYGKGGAGWPFLGNGPSGSSKSSNLPDEKGVGREPSGAIGVATRLSSTRHAAPRCSLRSHYYPLFLRFFPSPPPRPYRIRGSAARRPTVPRTLVEPFRRPPAPSRRRVAPPVSLSLHPWRHERRYEGDTGQRGDTCTSGSLFQRVRHCAASRLPDYRDKQPEKPQ